MGVIVLNPISSSALCDCEERSYVVNGNRSEAEAEAAVGSEGTEVGVSLTGSDAAASFEEDEEGSLDDFSFTREEDV